MSDEQVKIEIGVFGKDTFPTIDELNRRYTIIVLDRVLNNKYEASRVLGITVKTLYNKLKRWGLMDKYRIHGRGYYGSGQS